LYVLRQRHFWNHWGWSCNTNSNW